jgi:hypothetical protein
MPAAGDRKIRCGCRRVFYPVGVVLGTLDYPGAGPVPALGVEVLLRDDAGLDPGEDVIPVLRGKAAGSAAHRRTMRTSLCGWPQKCDRIEPLSEEEGFIMPRTSCAFPSR